MFRCKFNSNNRYSLGLYKTAGQGSDNDIISDVDNNDAHENVVLTNSHSPQMYGPTRRITNSPAF